MRRLRSLLVAVLLAAPLTALARAEDTARQILDRAKQLDDTTRKWTDRSQTLTLTIHGKTGAPRERSLQIFDKRGEGGEDKSLTFFLAPSEVKGTAFLQWSHPGKDDEQWLYLPELKRSRRITSQLRDQSFMGTDFSYRDLEILAEIREWTEEQAVSSLLGAEDVDGLACWAIALAPTTEDGYEKIVLYLDKEQLVTRKVVFQDGKGTAVKILTQSDVRPVGAIPTAYRMEMQTPAKESRTTVVLTKVEYNAGLGDDFFTERQLQRGPR
ncbi:MAG TPA: outer membrane lipoprotein-sorting protein [Candidatus Limnocylindria bacterium]|nr:outer membrane lipoprotein-sorting protein [Candidatus Limnocylindria bacterium]